MRLGRNNKKYYDLAFSLLSDKNVRYVSVRREDEVILATYLTVKHIFLSIACI